MSWKNGWLIMGLIILIAGAGWWRLRGARIIWESQETKTAEDLWKARDMASYGTFEKISTWTDEEILDTFPDLRQIKFLEGVKYSSREIDSVDLILKVDLAKEAMRVMSLSNEVNKINRFQAKNSNWVVGLFDWETAKRVNGYVNKEIKEPVVWLQISNIK